MNIEASAGLRRRSRSLLVALLALAMIAGCAGLPSGMEAPAVTIADFSVVGGSVFEQQFNLKLRIQNPNATDLTFDGVAFDLEINGEPFAKGVYNQLVTFLRFGTALMPVEAISSLGGLLRQVGALVHWGKSGFSYRINGVLNVGDGTRVPFDRRGEFDLGADVLNKLF